MLFSLAFMSVQQFTDIYIAKETDKIMSTQEQHKRDNCDDIFIQDGPARYSEN